MWLRERDESGQKERMTLKEGSRTGCTRGRYWTSKRTIYDLQDE